MTLPHNHWNWRNWLAAIRPQTLLLSAAPVTVGLALAGRETRLDPAVALATLATALLLQIAANLTNDWADAEKGVDTPERVGPVRLSHSGALSRRGMKRATLAVLVAAAGCGFVLMLHGGWPILLLGGIAILSAVAYSAGPRPLSWLGMGEFLAFVFFGPVAVAGSAYLQLGRVDGLMLLASLPSGLMASAVMTVNNLRDIDTDRRAAKATLAVRFGDRAMRFLYSLLITLCFVAIAALARRTGWGPTLALLPLPLGLREVFALWHRQREELNLSLTRTAILGGSTGGLLAIGLSL